jgi:phage recombination protein Bet
MTEQAKGVMVYKAASGVQVKLSPAIVRQYLVSGNAKVSDQEVVLFMQLCSHAQLDPFLRDAYLVKYGDSAPASMVIGKDAYLRRASSHPAYDGHECTVSDDGATATATVYRKDRSHPVRVTVDRAEYDSRRGSWNKMPRTMLRKVALVQALRESFPDVLGGMYSEDEMPVAASVGQPDLPRAPVQTVEAEYEPMEQPKPSRAERIKAAAAPAVSPGVARLVELSSELRGRGLDVPALLVDAGITADAERMDTWDAETVAGALAVMESM